MPCGQAIASELASMERLKRIQSQITMGGFQYLLNLGSPPSQTNLTTGKVRALQRRTRPPAAPTSRSQSMARTESVVSTGAGKSAVPNLQHVWEAAEAQDPANVAPDEHCHVCLLEFPGACGQGSENAPKRQCVDGEQGKKAAEPFDCIRLPKCVGHYFHRDCIEKWFREKPKCPSCLAYYGEEIGPQPDGQMTCRKMPHSLAGFEGYGCIEIMYSIPNGIQDERHPNPGERFYGTTRCAYLPDTPEGNKVLRLLQRAFKNRLVFNVGTSLTTGASNSVIWNGIHHKTSRYGGPFGYPDPTFLNRVTEELASKGIID